MRRRGCRLKTKRIAISILQKRKEDRMFVYHGRISGQGISHGLWSQSLLIKSHTEEMFCLLTTYSQTLSFWGSLDVATSAPATEGTRLTWRQPLVS